MKRLQKLLNDVESLLPKTVIYVLVSLTVVVGYEYVIEHTNTITPNDTVLDFGKFKIVVDDYSVPFLKGSTLDYVREGLNECFKIFNPNEITSCGCGVSVQF